jgi:hypothetical protein
MTLKHKKPKGPKLWQLAIDYLSLRQGSLSTLVHMTSFRNNPHQTLSKTKYFKAKQSTRIWTNILFTLQMLFSSLFVLGLPCRKDGNAGNARVPLCHKSRWKHIVWYYYYYYWEISPTRIAYNLTHWSCFTDKYVDINFSPHDVISEQPPPDTLKDKILIKVISQVLVDRPLPLFLEHRFFFM